MKGNRMNKLLGLVKLRYLILINSKRNMSLMDTEQSLDVMNKKCYDFGHMEFFENFDEFKDMIKNMKDCEKKVFLSMPQEQTRENYFTFNYIKPNEMVSYIEKENGRVKCTFNKKYGLKRDKYEEKN